MRLLTDILFALNYTGDKSYRTWLGYGVARRGPHASEQTTTTKFIHETWTRRKSPTVCQAYDETHKVKLFYQPQISFIMFRYRLSNHAKQECPPMEINTDSTEKNLGARAVSGPSFPPANWTRTHTHTRGPDILVNSPHTHLGGLCVRPGLSHPDSFTEQFKNQTSENLTPDGSRLF